MVKNLTRHGNSYALVIDRAVLDLLQATPETPFEVITDGQCLILRPVRSSDDEQRFQQALESAHKRFGRALKRLAE